MEKQKQNENHPYFVKTQAQLEREAPKSTQPDMITIYQSDFGKVVWEDDGPQSDYQRRNEFTNERLHTNKWREYENKSNIYMPEARLLNYRRKPVRIPEMRMDGFNYGIPFEPSKEDHLLTSNDKTKYNHTNLMHNDNSDKRTRSKSNFTVFNERLISSRF